MVIRPVGYLLNPGRDWPRKSETVFGLGGGELSPVPPSQEGSELSRPPPPLLSFCERERAGVIREVPTAGIAFRELTCRAGVPEDVIALKGAVTKSPVDLKNFWVLRFNCSNAPGLRGPVGLGLSIPPRPGIPSGLGSEGICIFGSCGVGSVGRGIVGNWNPVEPCAAGGVSETVRRFESGAGSFLVNGFNVNPCAEAGAASNDNTNKNVKPLIKRDKGTPSVAAPWNCNSAEKADLVDFYWRGSVAKPAFASKAEYA